MKHYHGTPIGGKRSAAEDFCERRHLLIPWKRPEDLERAMEYSRGFMVDNSAFSFWTSGEKPNWTEYVKWCRTFARHPRFDFALVPDAIDGSERDNDDLLRIWDRHGWHPVRIAGCPVWHLHESIDRLKKLCGGRWERVAIGSSGEWPNPGVGTWWDRMDEAFDAIVDEDGYPLAHMHGLRMLRSDIIQRYPFASCDSTNAVQNGARTAVQIGTDSSWGQMTIARRIERTMSPSRWLPKSQRQNDLFSLSGEFR